MNDSVNSIHTLESLLDSFRAEYYLLVARAQTDDGKVIAGRLTQLFRIGGQLVKGYESYKEAKAQRKLQARLRSRGRYKYTTLHPDDFFYPMARGDGRIPEHRLIMARHLKRLLQPWEHVHHKDGDKTNNHLSNLELTDGRNHITSHNRGYRDGYDDGLHDGRPTQIRQLKKEIAQLQQQLSQHAPSHNLKLSTGEAR